MLKQSVYEIITNQVISSLEQGFVPWRKTWSGDSVPCNYLTKRQYSGLNLFLLNTRPFSSRYYLTFLQVKELGGKVKKGESATPIVFWKLLERDEVKNDGKVCKEEIPVLRYYSVFNAEQIEEIEFVDDNSALENKENFTPIQKAEDLITDIDDRIPEIRFSDDTRAYYHQINDFIHLPKNKYFENEEDFYSVLFHEIIHSSGNEKRLNRKSLVNALHFGDTNYSKEELVAEMGATFLCSHCSILEQTFDNSKAYIAGWISKLKSNPKLLVEASTQAQKAVNYLLDA